MVACRVVLAAVLVGLSVLAGCPAPDEPPSDPHLWEIREAPDVDAGDGRPSEEPEPWPQGRPEVREPSDAGPTHPPELPDPPDVPGPTARAAVLSGDGLYLLVPLSVADEAPCLAVVALGSGAIERPAGLCGLRAVVAAPEGGRAYLLDETGTRLVVLRLGDLAVEREVVLEDAYAALEAAPDGRTLVLSNRPTDAWSESQYEWRTYELSLRHVAVVGTTSWEAHALTVPFAVRDIAFSPVDGAVLVVMSWWQDDGQPEARVHFVNPATGAVETELAFPNCADELAVQPDGTRAVLAPRQCFVHPVTVAPPGGDEWPDADDEWSDWDEFPEADPSSVIDLTERRFLGNLPGFGPVAIAPDGRTGVAFSRRETLMRQWNVFQQARVGLVLIRLADLYWRVVEYGEDEPDFFFAPRSATVLLHDREGGEDRVLSLDAESGALAVLGGLPTALEARAATPDGAVVYTVHEGHVRRILVASGTVTDVPVDVVAGQVLARPQGDTVIVVAADGGTLHVLDAAGGFLARTIALR